MGSPVLTNVCRWFEWFLKRRRGSFIEIPEIPEIPHF